MVKQRYKTDYDLLASEGVARLRSIRASPRHDNVQFPENLLHFVQMRCFVDISDIR